MCQHVPNLINLDLDFGRSGFSIKLSVVEDIEDDADDADDADDIDASGLEAVAFLRRVANTSSLSVEKGLVLRESSILDDDSIEETGDLTDFSGVIAMESSSFSS